MIINAPEAVTELQALYPLYEQTLMANDTEKAVVMFWAGPQVIRLGATENPCGLAEFEVFRRNRPGTGLAHRYAALHREFWRDFASITLEFERATEAGKVRGRQSRVWVRLAGDLRIVKAHDSLLSS